MKTIKIKSITRRKVNKIKVYCVSVPSGEVVVQKGVLNGNCNFGFIFSLMAITFSLDDKNFDVKALNALSDKEIIEEFKKYKGSPKLLLEGRVPTIQELRFAMAELFRNAFFSSYSGIVSYTHKVQKQAIETGYVESVLGGRRYLEALQFDHVIQNGKVLEYKGKFVTKKDCDSKRIANLLAIAINSPVQAFESHIISKAMIDIHKFIIKNRLNCYLAGTIHDAIIIAFPPEEEKHLKDFLNIMEQPRDIYEGIPIKADCMVGEIFGFKGEVE